MKWISKIDKRNRLRELYICDKMEKENYFQHGKGKQKKKKLKFIRNWAGIISLQSSKEIRVICIIFDLFAII